MQLLPMASSPDGLISAPGCGQEGHCGGGGAAETHVSNVASAKLSVHSGRDCATDPRRARHSQISRPDRRSLHRAQCAFPGRLQHCSWEWGEHPRHTSVSCPPARSVADNSSNFALFFF